MRKYIINFIVACALLASCEQERLIFNESQTFVEFEQSNLDCQWSLMVQVRLRQRLR